MSTDGMNGLKETNQSSNGLRSRNIRSTENQENGKKEMAQKKRTLYYGGTKGALLYIIISPIAIYVLQFQCTKDRCTILQWPQISTRLSDYLDVVSIMYFVIFLALTAVFTGLKLGPTVNGEPSEDGRCLKYNLNGIVNSIIVLIGMGMLIFTKFPFTIVLAKQFAFTTCIIIFTFVSSILLYWKSFSCPEDQLNFYGNTGNVIYDFFVGRETNPRIGDFDIKIFLRCFGLLAWCAIDVAFIATQNEQLGSATHTLLLTGFGHVLLMLDHLIFEEGFLTSFTMKHQGTGFFYVANTVFIGPMLASCSIIYVCNQNLHIESEAYTIFLLGFIVASHFFYRFANADKSSFLRYPDHPEVANYQYIPAINGKRILADGWWAFSRHPNYLAEILVAISWCATAGVEDPITCIYIVYVVPILLHQMVINEDASRREFGDKAWDAYCEKVPYKLIKYIY